MGTLTESELKDEVKRALGNRDDMDSRLVRFLNLAQTKMARTHEFEELQTVTDASLGYTGTAADDKFLDVATTIKTIYSFRIFDSAMSRKLEYIPSRQWDKRIPLPEYYATGWPSHYTKWRHKLEFWRVPKQAFNYEMRHSVWPTAFSDSLPSATSDFLNKDDIIIYLAVSWAYASSGKTQKATEFWQFYRTAMNSAIGDDIVSPDMTIAPNVGGGIDGVELGKYWADPFVGSVS